MTDAHAVEKVREGKNRIGKKLKGALGPVKRYKVVHGLTVEQHTGPSLRRS